MIENEFVTLHKLNSDDLSFYRLVYTNDKLMEFVSPTLNEKSSKRSFASTLKKMAMLPPDVLLFVIYSKIHQCKVGVIGLRWNQASGKQVEIGIIILKKYQRIRLAHQAKSLLINHGFKKLNIKSILAICDKQNIAANCANKKLGFTLSHEMTNQNKREQIAWEIKI